jgi:hypothetical protein
MALQKKAWRISRFGTILLSKEMRDAVWMVMRLKIQIVRGPAYYSQERIPQQTVHGWVTLRDSDGYVTQDDFDWRFDAQRFTLWDDTAYIVNINQCFIANQMLEVILQELAKKPNIPPIPPSIPPVDYQEFFGNVPMTIRGISAISIDTKLNADFDVELFWFPRNIDRCSPLPEDFPRGPVPLEDKLPVPGGDNSPAPPQYFPPASGAPGSPPLGGTAFIPPGFSSGDQSSPPNEPPLFPPGATRTTFRVAFRPGSSESQGCVQRALAIASAGPYTGLYPKSALEVVPKSGDGSSGFPCNAVRYNRDYVVAGIGVVLSLFENCDGVPTILDPVYT